MTKTHESIIVMDLKSGLFLGPSAGETWDFVLAYKDANRFTSTRDAYGSLFDVLRSDQPIDRDLAVLGIREL